MTERIDHAAKAREALVELDVTDPSATNLPADWCGASEDEQWLVHATLEEAQVHATLTLVEQQLIANLIALWNLSNASKFNLLTSGGVDPEAADESASIILGGLGLT